MKSLIKLLSMFLFILSIVGCGLKGPLYHPTEASNNQTDQSTMKSLNQEQIINKVA
ncbi:LPS translocon maturation chaperone LptM [Gilliamella sp. CG25]|uniref:LPS translocon maturation chaperone LptM n=1 Tax=unclassified Gilliamella TaxID=2685620 RepID=UPI003987C71C